MRFAWPPSEGKNGSCHRPVVVGRPTSVLWQLRVSISDIKSLGQGPNVAVVLPSFGDRFRSDFGGFRPTFRFPMPAIRSGDGAARFPDQSWDKPVVQKDDSE